MVSENFENPIIDGGDEEKEEYSVDDLRESIEEEKENKPESEDRRETLKTLLKFAGIIAGSVALDKFGNFAKAAEAWSEKEKNEVDNKDNEEEKWNDYEVYYINDYAKPIARALDFRSEDPIKIDIDILDEAKVYWMVKYMDNAGYNKSLKEAHEKMQQWVPALSVIFKSGGNKEVVDELDKMRKKNSPKTAEEWQKLIESNPELRKISENSEEEEIIPEKYMYLAIPESHWKKAKSKKGAGGYYQFTRSTARGYGLKMNSKVDERNDELKSAGACARCLGDLYKRTGDWDTSLAGYNGGFIWRYIKSKQKKLEYGDFVGKHLSRDINELKKEIKEKSYIRKKISKGKGYWKLAKKYKVNVEQLEKFNNKKNSELRAGENIKIPLKNKKHREYVYNKEVAGYKENLNYVPKVNAILSLIEQGMV